MSNLSNVWVTVLGSSSKRGGSRHWQREPRLLTPAKSMKDSQILGSPAARAAQLFHKTSAVPGSQGRAKPTGLPMQSFSSADLKYLDDKY